LLDLFLLFLDGLNQEGGKGAIAHCGMPMRREVLKAGETWSQVSNRVTSARNFSNLAKALEILHR